MYHRFGWFPKETCWLRGACSNTRSFKHFGTLAWSYHHISRHISHHIWHHIWHHKSSICHPYITSSISIKSFSFPLASLVLVHQGAPRAEPWLPWFLRHPHDQLGSPLRNHGSRGLSAAGSRLWHHKHPLLTTWSAVWTCLWSWLLS